MSQNRNKTQVHQVAPQHHQEGGDRQAQRLATGVEEHMILNSARSETKFADFAGNGGTLRRHVVQRKGRRNRCWKGYTHKRPLAVKELKGNDESEEE